MLILPIYGFATASYNVWHTVLHMGPLCALAALATSSYFSRQLRSVFVSLGLLTAAAMLVHLTGGLIEAHFYFFVVIVALTLYEDWLPFLLAVGYVLFHHGVVGTIEPHEVFNRPDAWANPWAWAGVHAFFVALAGVAGVAAWRLNEGVRDRMRAVQRELAVLSETDALTELGNRRKAMADLEALFATDPEPTVLVLLDLDGFKSYNDTFGHPAGDSLLARLGHRLSETVGERARAYRIGGDEFCVIAPGSHVERAELEASAVAALSEHGQAFQVGASPGSVLIPMEAHNASDAMRLADQRMYSAKYSLRTSPGHQSKDVLLQVLVERQPEIGDHLNNVRALVEPLAVELEVPATEVGPLLHAAELHDIGKVAIPDTILSKPGPLDEEEWEFMRRHTIIGQRIVCAAPALAGVGEIIRASHERWDGNGYPDGLTAREIPLAARIIAVCDAYDAMTSDRPYRRALASEMALAELRRCAGSQFDVRAVEAFEAVRARPQPKLASVPTAATPAKTSALRA